MTCREGPLENTTLARPLEYVAMVVFMAAGISIQSLRVFLSILEHSSLSAAGRELGMTLSLRVRSRGRPCGLAGGSSGAKRPHSESVMSVG